MKHLTLGKSDLRVSRIGLGTLAFGGHYGTMERKDVLRTIHHAVDNGITWFDTATWYGGGMVEHMLGEALQSRRSDVVIATKVRIGIAGDTFDAHNVCLQLRQQVDESLRRLRTDYLDLCQLYVPNPHMPLQSALETLDAMQSEGRVRYAGFYDAEVPMLKTARDHGPIVSVQGPYHMLNLSLDDEVIPFCRAAGIGVIACEPMCRGLLLGKFQRTSTFELDDLRLSDPRFKGAAFLANVENANRLQAFAAQEGMSAVQLAIGWVLANPGVTAAACGARTPEQIREILMADEVTLTPEHILSVDQIVRGNRRQKPV